MALVLPALTDCRWWFESLLVHSGVSSATRRKATGADHKKNPRWGEPWFPHSAVLLFLTCLSYGDFRLVSCSVAFVSRHTNPFDDAQVIISSTVLAGSTFHHAAGGSLCVSWLCLVFGFVCFCFCLFSVSFGIVMAPLDRVLVLQQHGLFWFIFSPRWKNFQLH